MIEVEKKFQPTKEQLEVFLADAEFMKEKVLHDIYYDYPDYSLFKNYVYFRNRNGRYELKVGKSEAVGAPEMHEEIEDEERIKNYFKTSKSIEDFTKENFNETLNFKTTRKEYKKGEFIVDVDKLHFGYECVEVELLVDTPAKVPETKNKILEFAKQYGWEVKKLPRKREEYFRIVKPELYEELFKKGLL